MLVPPEIRLRISTKDFEALCRENPDLRLERSARGVLEVMSPASASTGGRNAILTARIVMWALEDGTGKAFDSSAGFTLPNTAVTAPDASWIASERWNRVVAENQADTFALICPDFIAELRSKTDGVRELRKKMLQFISQGTRLGWLIDPYRGVVEIYRPGRVVEILDRPSMLSGEGVLPGLVLDLRGILVD